MRTAKAVLVSFMSHRWFPHALPCRILGDVEERVGVEGKSAL